jgi:hypothetical protein
MKRAEIIQHSFEELKKTEEYLNAALKHKKSILKYLENELLNEPILETNEINEFSTSEEEFGPI